MTAADLGFEKGYTRVVDIHQRAMQLGLQLRPAEVGPQLRLQYPDQRVGEFLQVAMPPIPTYHGELVDLTVGNGGAGLLLLGGNVTFDQKQYSTTKFVFVRSPQVARADPPTTTLQSLKD